MAASTPDPDFLAYADHRDPEAFRRMVSRHLPAVEATARRTLGHGGHLAADLALSATPAHIPSTTKLLFLMALSRVRGGHLREGKSVYDFSAA